MDTPIRYRLLRDGLQWDTAARSALVVDEGGCLSLGSIPAPSDRESMVRPAPYDAIASGIAVDSCGRMMLSDGKTSSLLLLIPSCSFRYVLDMSGGRRSPLQVSSPAGLAVVDDVLYVANPAAARVDLITLPTMELRATRTAGLQQPTSVAIDRDRRLYVVDRGSGRLVRFLANGSADFAFNAATASQINVASPWSVAVIPNLGVLVSDGGANQVFAFGFDGALLGHLDLSSTPACRPRALACNATRICLADEASGAILVFDALAVNPLDGFLGEVPDFRAPVSAMTFDSAGKLYVKFGNDDSYAVLEATRGCARTGTMTSERLDAGIESDWERVVVRADVHSDTNVILETFVTADPAANPALAPWRPSPTLDCLVHRDRGPSPKGSRYLWVRVTLTSSDGSTSPSVAQVQAQTTGRSYLRDLPAIYRRDDQDTRFLERWLALFRSDMEDFEREFETMPIHFDPQTAPAAELQWVAQLVGFDPPADTGVDRLRALLARVPRLYAERGTLSGLRDWAEIYCGIRPRILEAWPARRIWSLEATSLLGFDTMLPAGGPDGFIVPGIPVTDPAYAGLRRDEYGGGDFDWYLSSTTDKVIDFTINPARQDGAGHFISVGTLRWTGQFKPHYRERYAISISVSGAAPADDVRVNLWIDSKVWVNQWQEGNGTMQSVQQTVAVLLEEDRWYPLRLDVRTTAAALHVRLMWSSRSQRDEVIPAECLYSVLDEHADMTATEDVTFKIGSAVVGEAGPLAPSSFGQPLFSDYAHLFTVLAPAGCACDADRRTKLRQVIDAEKPAHTDYHLCFIQPRMRVGFQARLGIDAIVANGPAPMRLNEQEMGRGSYLADLPGKAGRVGDRATVGQNLIVG